MTTNEIADIILNSMCERRFPVFLTTASIGGMHEADVLGINKAGFIYEYEIKRSRSDFKADFKKKHKHRNLKERISHRIYNVWENGKITNKTQKVIMIPSRFFYACEENLISPEEIPEYAGLVYVNEVSGLTEIKKAKLLHKEKAPEYVYKAIASTLCQRITYGCSYFTFKFNKLKTTK